MNWATVKLSEIATIERDQINPAALEAAVAYLGLEDIEAGGRIIQARQVERGDLASSKFRFTREHILYGKLRPYLAKISLPDFEGICSTDILPLRPRSAVDRRYLAYFLRQPESVERANLRTTGANLPRLSPKALAEFDVPLPPIAQQRRIAAVLDKADAIRRKRERAVALADDFIRSAYLHIVGMKHPDFLDWQPATIESLAEEKRGSIRSGPFGSALLHSEFVNEGVAVLGIDNAVKNKFQWAERRFITRGKYEELRRYRVYPNDVIITIMGTTGRSAVVPDDIPEAITTKHLASITCDLAKVLPEVLSFAIHSDPVVIDQIRAANKGAIMDGLNLGIIRQIKIRTPPMSQQRIFAELLKTSYSAIRRMTTPTGDGSDLFASLSHRAFRGEL
jgi:type I restriction enzyme S subunit